MTAGAFELAVHRVFAREPEVVITRFAVEDLSVDGCVDVDVLVHGRAWELHVHAAPVHAVEQAGFCAWLSGTMTSLGALGAMGLAARLTPRRMYADLDIPVGNRVLFDELDHVIPARINDAGVVAADGVVVDALDAEGTVGVIPIVGEPWRNFPT